MSQEPFDHGPRSHTTGYNQVRPTTPPDSVPSADPQPGHEHHGLGHGLMMLLMCAPMLVLFTLVVVSGLPDAGAFIAVIACMAMMALMMRGMGHGSGDR